LKARLWRRVSRKEKCTAMHEKGAHTKIQWTQGGKQSNKVRRTRRKEQGGKNNVARSKTAMRQSPIVMGGKEARRQGGARSNEVRRQGGARSKEVRRKEERRKTWPRGKGGVKIGRSKDNRY